jgi:ABC-type sulfate/molybdate transport systems ATPase subunit
MIKAAIAKKLPAGPESPEFTLDVEFEAGKTLTLDAIAGFLQPDCGRILLDDRILFDAGSGVHLPPQKRTCGYVFQNHALFPNMTIRENLAFAADSLPRLERHRRIAETLDRFQLTPMAGRYPHELSGGQKQRAAIARALIADPRLILLDEPGRGMDAHLRADLHILIQELRTTLKVPIFLVTHDAEECMALADRVLVYQSGRIIQRGTPAELLANPGTVAAATILGGFNIFEAEVIAIDPGRQTSRLRLLGDEITGPNLRGCFKGDRITVATRPEELTVAARSGDNSVRSDLVSATERPQSVRANFGSGLIVDIPRETWRTLEETARKGSLWVQIPPQSLRQLTGMAPESTK